MRTGRHTQIHLLRHGEFADAGASFPPARNASLTAAGREQARGVAEFLALRRPSSIYTSPLRRAVETADIISSRVGFAAKVSQELRGDRSLDPGELARTSARASRELERIARLHRGERVVCVTHEDVIVASVLRFSGRAYTAFAEIGAGFCAVWTLSVVGRYVTLSHLDHAEIAARVARSVA